jgi:hypothetical protein
MNDSNLNNNNLTREVTTQENKKIVNGTAKQIFIIITVFVALLIFLIASGVITLNAGFSNLNYSETNEKKIETDNMSLENYIDIFMLKQDELMQNLNSR